MNKKSIIIATAFAFVFSLAATAGVSFASDGPETITLKSAAGTKPAEFSHRKHQEMDGMECATCHHGKDADGKQTPYSGASEEVQKCISCHNKTDMANLKLNSFKLAGHAQCKGCHKTKKAAGNANAPTKCGGCHPKKEG